MPPDDEVDDLCAVLGVAVVVGRVRFRTTLAVVVDGMASAVTSLLKVLTRVF